MPFLPVLLELVGRPLLHTVVAPEPRAPLVRLPQPPPGRYTVRVADWGHHTAIVVQQPPGWRLGPPGAETAPFLEFAWGDRRFFHGQERGPRAVAAALFLPTDSVLFLAGHPDPPRLAGMVAVRERQVEAPSLPGLPSRPSQRGRFFPAHATYLWSRNGNWWTVQRLREAGLASGTAGVVVAGQVPGRLRGFRPLSTQDKSSSPTVSVALHTRRILGLSS